MPISDKIKEILLNLKQYDLPEQRLEIIIKELNNKIFKLKNQAIGVKENK